MLFIGVVTNHKNEIYIRDRLSNLLPKENVIFITGKNIANIKNIKFETLIIDTKIDNRNDFRKIVSNAKYVILNADIEINVELFSDLSLTVITYGFNNKATFTVSSITENIIIICLQRIIFHKKGYMIEPQEYQIENQINIEKYTLIAISILDILYN